MKQRKRPVRINALAFANLITALIDGGYTAMELVDVTGLGINAVRRYVTALHKAHAIYVSGWDEDDVGRYKARQYTLGEGVDVPRPKPAPRSLRDARWKAKLRNIKLLKRMAA